MMIMKFTGILYDLDYPEIKAFYEKKWPEY